MALSDYKFAAFILTHGRADRVVTYRSLRKSHFTAPIYFIVDDEDDDLPLYRRNFGEDRVLVFSKDEVAERIDEGAIVRDRISSLYARNVAFDFAEQLGLDYFLELDDDYVRFEWRFDDQVRWLPTPRLIHNLDAVCEIMLRYYASVPRMLALCMAQGGDFMGGRRGPWPYNFLKRKAMNVFFLSPHRRFRFVGWLNDDVNTYVVLGMRGELFFTTPLVKIKQIPTQSQTGGVTSTYKSLGTYSKSFMSVVYAPAVVRVGMMGYHPRVHHLVRWDCAVPQIVPERLRKVDA